jgi:hypothetical protein
VHGRDDANLYLAIDQLSNDVELFHRASDGVAVAGFVEAVMAMLVSSWSGRSRRIGVPHSA